MTQFNRLYLNLLEGIHDKNRFKAIFVVGPLGAGKSYVVNNIINNGNLKVLDMDQSTEFLLHKHGIGNTPVKDLNLSKLSSKEEDSFQKLRDRARSMTYGEIEEPSQPLKSRSKLLVDGGIGLIVAGSGKNYNYTLQSINYYKSQGYDVMMVAVMAPLEVCIAGNRARSRKLSDKLIKQTYKEVCTNLPKFQKILGDDFIIYDNSQRGSNKDIFTPLAIKVKKFLNRPHEQN